MDKAAVRIGPAGWSYQDWGGWVYPLQERGRTDQLAYLAEYFEVLEINSTFYRPADHRSARSWVRRVSGNPNFKFTVKLWQRFTHQGEPSGAEEERLFKSGLEPLLDGGVLGCILIQHPWSFKNLPENRARLEELFEAFKEYPKVVEVRHASWNAEPVFRFLSDHGVGFVNVDQPVIGQSLGPTERATGPVGYIRLHGRNYQDWFREEAGRDARYNYLYSEEELKPWAQRAERVSEGASETYIITNNHYRGQAVVNALQLKFMLTGKKVKVPEPLKARYPVLEKICQS